MSQFIELELASGSKAVFHLAGNYVIVDKEKETVKNARFNGKVKGVCYVTGSIITVGGSYLLNIRSNP